MSRTLERYADGMTWGEGPRWHDGSLWLSDTQGSRLWTDASGSWQAHELASVPNGLWFLPDGRLVAAMMRECRLATWTGSGWETYADLTGVATGPLGDLVGDSAGNLYVDDVAFDAPGGDAPGPGRIVLVRPDGGAIVATDQVEFPNGMAFVDNGETLVVAETSRQRLTAFRVADDGTLHDPRTYADVAELVGPGARPDGIWPAAEGLWVATTTGELLVRLGDGVLLESVPTPGRFPIACSADDDSRVLVTLAETDGAPLHEALRKRAVRTSAWLLGPDSPNDNPNQRTGTSA